MEGCGNDYVFLDDGLVAPAQDRSAQDLSRLARRIADRHTGVGGDGLILISPGEAAPLRMRMFNADGSEGRLCLNGLRCAALLGRRLASLEEAFTVETASGPRPVRVRPTGPHAAEVTVRAGRPEFRRETLPALGEGNEVWGEPFTLAGGESALGYGVSVGNPHLVLWIDAPEHLDAIDLPGTGAPLERDPRFPERINVHLAAAVGSSRLRMRSWERGSGVTRACGSGAAAVFAVARRLKRIGVEAAVAMPGGVVRLREEEDEALELTGPAVEVFEGEWHASSL